MTRSPGRRVAHRTMAVLAWLGTLLLVASTAVELSNTNARAELWLGAGASATFLVAMALNHGSDARALALRARFLAGAGLSALLAVAALWQATERSAPRVLLLLIPVCVLFTTAAMVLREAAHHRRQARIRELVSRQAGEEAERRRWVRELHDDTLQELAAVHVRLAAAAVDPDPGAQAAAIVQTRDIVSRQIHALRRLIASMRPLALDALGLSAALEDLARHTGDTAGVDVQVHAPRLPRLRAETETTIYRIVQEALTNAARHAGAGHITVDLQACDRALDIVVRDDGHGHPTGRFTPGHGLNGMHERAEILGGALHITTGAAGTTIRLHVPAALSGSASAGTTRTVRRSHASGIRDRRPPAGASGPGTRLP